MNFNVYYLLLIRRPKDAGRCEELRGYLAVVAIAILPVIIVYLLLSKFIVRGVALGGVKG